MRTRLTRPQVHNKYMQSNSHFELPRYACVYPYHTTWLRARVNIPNKVHVRLTQRMGSLRVEVSLRIVNMWRAKFKVKQIIDRLAKEGV